MCLCVFQLHEYETPEAGKSDYFQLFSFKRPVSVLAWCVQHVTSRATLAVLREVDGLRTSKPAAGSKSGSLSLAA